MTSPTWHVVVRGHPGCIVGSYVDTDHAALVRNLIRTAVGITDTAAAVKATHTAVSLSGLYN